MGYNMQNHRYGLMKFIHHPMVMSCNPKGCD